MSGETKGAYEATERQEPTTYGACGVAACDDCRPLYDEDNNVIPGTEFGPS